MSALEIVLAAALAALTGLFAVQSAALSRARRRVRWLEDASSRPRLTVPTPSEAVRTVVGTAIKLREHGVAGTIRSSIDDLAGWADVERPDLAQLAAADGTVTIMFSDIEGSTQLNHDLGDRGWVQLLARHDRLLTKAIRAHDGHVVKTQGDGFMVAFAEASQAVGAACAIQRALARARGGRLADVRVRIGAHRGSAVHRDGDLFGRNVALAARVAAQAHGAEVLVSDAVIDALAPDGPTVLEAREATLKGIPGVQRLHLLDWR
ncbi:adenylate/guanylate cyclase domain-containing protein [Aeromicrobium wangtongii]|uniref:Adenylate/guanylate cyclase domain-containing protein n=1 Tax=Aeromicrobium wangtongii TaxID=2969247 RepID=A0ABY5MA36_9ACTN|nr:adenylate/guanylate cyclase domain-containing protein [Aeromicrobium wangtongii]MCD9199555.1 adenylate/guanylate cyclase domain-containing protein [Aeromicrobium wangtongii]UUP13908.1 adenylate/guanylate cyclase domain-containing protein [Aeromicrobium wangtongii]